MTRTEQQAFTQAQHDSLKGINQNPYDEGTREFAAYEAGVKDFVNSPMPAVAFDEGYAFRYNGGIWANPYDIKTPAGQAWEAGMRCAINDEFDMMHDHEIGEDRHGIPLGTYADPEWEEADSLINEPFGPIGVSDESYYNDGNYDDFYDEPSHNDKEYID